MLVGLDHFIVFVCLRTKKFLMDFDYKILENWNKQTNGFETFLYRQLIG